MTRSGQGICVRRRYSILFSNTTGGRIHMPRCKIGVVPGRDVSIHKVLAPKVAPPLCSLGVLEIGLLVARRGRAIARHIAVQSIHDRAIEYVPKFVGTVAIARHAVADLTKFLMNRVPFAQKPFREVLVEGAPNMTCGIASAVVEYLNVRQMNSLPSDHSSWGASNGTAVLGRTWCRYSAVRRRMIGTRGCHRLF